MPVIVNELVTELQPDPVPQSSSQSPQSVTPVTLPEYEMLKVLNLIQERQARLQFD